jgi:hypothetical protein
MLQVFHQDISRATFVDIFARQSGFCGSKTHERFPNPSTIANAHGKLDVSFGHVPPTSHIESV